MQNKELIEKIEKSLKFLFKKKKILFITTSNRWSGEKAGDMPKSTKIAHLMKEKLKHSQVEILDISKMKIYPCEGNVSTDRWNSCWLPWALLKDTEKNPSWYHRCWVTYNNADDELWKISKALFESDSVVFFTSVRRWQTNAFYQKLIERLTWIENRVSTLWEENIVGSISAGIIVIGQNWHGKEVLETQKYVLGNFGFQVTDEICWNWQYLKDDHEESQESYKNAVEDFTNSLSQIQ